MVSLKYCLLSSQALGFHDPIWRAYFSNGLVQPPTRLGKKVWIKKCPNFISYRIHGTGIVGYIYYAKPIVPWMGYNERGFFSSLTMTTLEKHQVANLKGVALRKTRWKAGLAPGTYVAMASYVNLMLMLKEVWKPSLRCNFKLQTHSINGVYL